MFILPAFPMLFVFGHATAQVISHWLPNVVANV
jgi:hypothetical protein